ncbi:MAG TPA: hypothetical protein VMF04_00610 [Thermoplasmata archaeon]|nr:hypothetical protein [Thermoplasmata archaeon]
MKPPLTRDVERLGPERWPEYAPSERGGSLSGARDDAVHRRVSSLLDVSARFGTGIPVRDLASLLPPEGPPDAASLERWLAVRPSLARLDGERAFAPHSDAPELQDRLARGRAYRSIAERVLANELAGIGPWIRCAAITGSAAYAAPEAGDDLDFFLVTRTGTMWLCLLRATLAVRLRYRPTDSDERPRPCFNFVLDETTAPLEFRSRRGFLFAREALTAQVLRGDDYYRSLLAAAPWLGEEIPRLYPDRSMGEPPATPAPVPWPARLLNSILFPPLAVYLHLVGMYRNARERRAGYPERGFRTVVNFRRLATPTDRFDELSRAADRASVRGPSPAPQPVRVESVRDR